MTELRAEGLSVEVPGGWDVRIFRRAAQQGETTHAVLHAANFGLPAGVADYGDGAVQLMSSDDVLIALVEFHPSSADTALFATRGFTRPLRPDDAGRTTLQRALGGQAGIQRFFTEAGRAFCLYVVLGSYERRAALVGTVNDVLDRIEVSP